MSNDDDEPKLRSKHFHFNDVMAADTLKVIEFMKTIVPEENEDTEGCSGEVAAHRTTLLMFAYVTACINFNQPIDAMLQNIKVSHDILKDVVVTINNPPERKTH